MRRGDAIGSEGGDALLVCTGEADLQAAIARVPATRRDDVVLVQNEIFRADLTRLQVPHATVAVVWSAVKPDVALLHARPSRVHGRHASLFAQAGRAVGVPVFVVDEAGITVEMCAKYAFIVALNALGVIDAVRTAGDWCIHDAARVAALVDDGVRLAMACAREDGGTTQASTDVAIDAAAVHAAAYAGLRGFATLPCRGRQSQQRVERARQRAARLGVAMHALP